ncbi:hypothetical protein R1sor_017044 [Riccia sorocarpa]|uniref:CCHC-type domain-containing protein n=1 Tax=Riccia sorocarpa TaxID=122646 RepID=A0ABD3I8G1_9MARC
MEDVGLHEDVDTPESAAILWDDGYVEYEISYEPLPEGCFMCHKTDHVARFCPMTSTTRVVSQEELEEAMQKATKDQKKEKMTVDNEVDDEQVDDEQAEPSAPELAATTNLPRSNQGSKESPKNETVTLKPYASLQGNEEVEPEQEESATLDLKIPAKTDYEQEEAERNSAKKRVMDLEHSGSDKEQAEGKNTEPEGSSPMQHNCQGGCGATQRTNRKTRMERKR